MNIVVYPPGSANHIELNGVQHVTVWDDAGNVLLNYENAGPVTPPVEPPPVTEPPPTEPPPTQPPAGQFPTPVPPVTVPWPASGQVVLHVNLAPDQTCCYRLVWASAMDPNKFGRINTVEEPGSAVRKRGLQLNVNGVQKFSSMFVDTAPSCALSNAPTPGSPSQVMLAHGDTLDIIVSNDDSRTIQAANVLIDIMLPDRY